MLSRHTTSGSAFYTFDAHGSVCQRVSGGGTVLSTQTFDAYGLRQSTDGNSDPYCGFGGQSGYYTDWETGTAASALEMLGLRYYDPSAGRFLTRDPSDYKGGANLYEYCNDGPIGSSDPTGRGEGLPFPGGGMIGGCLAALAAGGITAVFDGCNRNYDVCIAAVDCFGNATGAAAAWAIAAALVAIAPVIGPFAFIIQGCLEGLLSSAIKTQAETLCNPLAKCSVDDSPGEWHCKMFAMILDTLFGCFQGFINSILEEFKPEIEAAIVAGWDMLGFAGESDCQYANDAGAFDP